MGPVSGGEEIYAAWQNHLNAFGGKDIVAIMNEYDENSIVQVFDNRENKYSEFKGTCAIKGMFVDLFKTIGDAGNGVEVGLLEIDPSHNSVFLVWRSNSHPKATDTFIFNGNMIARQNIVVTTTALPTDGAVQQVWDNHFGAFAGFNLSQIMLDYDESSTIATFNDACFDGASHGNSYAVHKGVVAIEEFFNNLFAQLNRNLANVASVGPNTGNPVVMEGEGGAFNANVFLTWTTANLEKPINYATDSFSFRKSGEQWKIDYQTIVTTEPNTECIQATDEVMGPVSGGEEIYAAWQNHLNAFGGKDIVAIMNEYDENSIVQVFDNREKKYSEFKGTCAIEGMFVDLFKAITDAGEGVEVGLLEIDTTHNSVFLVWKSNSHPKATDTFIFNGNMIARQNIVVTTQG